MLSQYYFKYITLFVAEYGLGSAYKNGYPDENAYIIALCMLIEMQKPLLDAEKRGRSTHYSSLLGIHGDLTFQVTAGPEGPAALGIRTHSSHLRCPTPPSSR